jgi:hypothetical protein
VKVTPVDSVMAVGVVAVSGEILAAEVDLTINSFFLWREWFIKLFHC